MDKKSFFNLVNLSHDLRIGEYVKNGRTAVVFNPHEKLSQSSSTCESTSRPNKGVGDCDHDEHDLRRGELLVTEIIPSECT